MQVKRLVLGTAKVMPGYGVTTSTDLAEDGFSKLLKQANRLGIEWIDTAQSYSSAESWISRSGLYQFKVATKISISGQSREAQLSKVVQSQELLGRDKIKIIFAHDWEDSRTVDRETFKSLQADFPAIKFGASLYETISLEELINQPKALSIIQIPLSVLNQSFLPLLAICQETNTEVWARSIFLQGVIDYHSPKNPFKEHKHIERLAKFCTARNLTPFQVAISFAFSTAVNKIVIGFENEFQLNYVVKLIQEPQLLIDFKELASDDPNVIDPRRWKLSD